jgi:stearoyl-CoA desaturase (Delta-9 desaturase)
MHPHLRHTLKMFPLVLMHLLPLLAFYTGVTWQAATFAFVWYWLGMFAVTGGYHRYFSHRTFKTGRIFQFILAFLAQCTSQKGVLWWAAHHRHHHKFSDEPQDIHSPRQKGFWYSHAGWIVDPKTEATDLSKVRDLAKYPELVFLSKYWSLPVVALGLLSYLWLGGPGFTIGFALSTVVLWHCTFTINSLSHVFGSQRYKTADDSRNNLFLALITMGEGWHNNHHHHMNSTRQGFYWWEIDVTYYILKSLSWLGLVWDLRAPPASVYEQQPTQQSNPLPMLDAAE